MIDLMIALSLYCANQKAGYEGVARSCQGFMSICVRQIERKYTYSVYKECVKAYEVQRK